MTGDPVKCILCDKQLTDQSNTREITGNSLESFINASVQRDDKRHIKIKQCESIRVHTNYAKSYTPDGKIKAYLRQKEKITESVRATRSSNTIPFDFESLCLICGEDASNAFIAKQSKYPASRRNVVRNITNNESKFKMLDKCRLVKNKLTIELSSQLERVENLIEVRAKYHDRCKQLLDNINPSLSEDTSKTAKVAEFISKYIIENKEECQFSIKAMDQPDHVTKFL